LKIGIYGGAFDPIHNGHLVLAETAREEYNLDLVLFLVSANPPHKGVDSLTDFADRYSMVELAIKDNPSFKATDIETKVKGKSYTYLVLNELFKLYGKENQYYLIIGEDEAVNFHTWFKYEEILDLCNVLVGERKGCKCELASLVVDKVKILSMPCIDISSSNMRERIKNNKSILYLTPKDVIDYVMIKELYK